MNAWKLKTTNALCYHLKVDMKVVKLQDYFYGPSVSHIRRQDINIYIYLRALGIRYQFYPLFAPPPEGRGDCECRIANDLISVICHTNSCTFSLILKRNHPHSSQALGVGESQL